MNQMPPSGFAWMSVPGMNSPMYSPRTTMISTILTRLFELHMLKKSIFKYLTGGDYWFTKQKTRISNGMENYWIAMSLFHRESIIIYVRYLNIGSVVWSLIH